MSELSNQPRETEEEIVVDVVGFTEDEVPVPRNHQSEDVPMATTETSTPKNSEPMKPSMSTDSGRTITDIVEDSPAPPTPAPPSPPSKKRKFTPESSPDEPLLSEFPAPPATGTIQPQESEIHAQIAVEKLQGQTPPQPSRANKKPKKTLIRRPVTAPAKKKVINGQRKPPKPKPKELSSMGIGLDDVNSLPIQSSDHY
jgi:hypothetical protein